MKRILHWVGGVLCLVGMVFVALRLYEYALRIDFGLFGSSGWGLIGLLAMAYGAANVLLAFAWRDLLGFLGTNTTRDWAVRAYGFSQLARYVPGNIFHLAGRQALGLAAGLPGRALAKSALWELGLISVVGALFATLALSLLMPELPVAFALISFAFILGITAVSALHWFGLPVAMALSRQASFLAISGGVFAVALELIAPQSVDATMIPAFCGAYVVAWLAGLVTPGAPAGMGVREFVLLFLLGGRVAEADLLLAVVLGRIITMGGDVTFFAFASLMNFRRESNAGS